MKLNFLKVFKESFGLKVFVTFTLLIFIISFSFTLFFIGYQSDYLRGTLIKKGELLIEIFAYNSRLGVFSENEEMLKIPVEGIYQQEGVLEVSVFNLEGQLLTKGERSKPGIPEKSVEGRGVGRHKIFEILMESGCSYYLEDNSKAEFWSPVISSSRYSEDDASLFLEGDLFEKRKRIIGFVGITVDKGMLKKQLHNLLIKSILIGIAFLVIGSGVTYFITKGVTRPLNKLTEGVKTLEKGGMAKEVIIRTKDEIGRLARAFNDMSRSLSKRERELQQSEESYRNLTNSITDVFFAMDKNLKYTYWNTASEELTGIPEKDAIGKPLFEIFPDNPETRKAERAYQEVLKTRTSKTFLNEYTLKGRRYLFDITAYPSRDGLSVFVRDVTKQKEIELAFWESEERYRSLFDGVPMGLYRTTPNGKVLDANRALVEIMGYPNREMILQANTWESYVTPKDREVFQATVEKQSAIHGFEAQLYRYDGMPVWVGIDAHVVKNVNGNILYYEGSMADITERKQSEKRITFLAEVLSSSPLSVIATDKGERIIYVNPATERLFGYTHDELLGKNPIILNADPNADKLQSDIFDTIGRGGVWRGDILNKKKSGEVFPIYASVYQLMDEEGNFIAIVGFQEDITERKRAEEELMRSKEQLRSLAAHLQSVRENERTAVAREIHDELGQALTGLKMDLSWMAKKIPQDKTQLLDKFHSMSELTSTTLKTVQRISTELRPGLLDDLGLVAAIEWQAEEFQNRTGIKCSITVDPEKITVDDKRSTALFRILQETLTNVARHAQATRVHVSLQEKDNHIRLRVRDNGTGITKEQISDPKSFGLIGIKERVHMWEGEVKITGRPGKGTTVVVVIPVGGERTPDVMDI